MLFIICRSIGSIRNRGNKLKGHTSLETYQNDLFTAHSLSSPLWQGVARPVRFAPAEQTKIFMATGVDTSENFDATTWPQALFGWHETLATASWQSWQWDAVSSWTDVIFSEASLTVVGLLAPGLSGGESFRMHVHVTLKSKQNMFLACFATVKLFFPSPLWPDFARQVRFVPANTDQNLSNDTSPLPLKSTQKLVDKMLLAWGKGSTLFDDIQSS